MEQEARATLILDPKVDGIRWIVQGKIAACSRAWAQAQPSLSDWRLIISVIDVGSLPATSRNVILHADDVPDGRHSFTKGQASIVAEWIGLYVDALPILCQCEHGQSRSVALALAVADHYGWEVPDRGQYEPNELVYRLVSEALAEASR